MRRPAGAGALAAAPTLRLGALCALAAAGLLRAPAPRPARALPVGERRAVTAPDVARFYFNVPAFAARGFVATCRLGRRRPSRRGRPSRPPRGRRSRSSFHGFAVSLIAVDWMLSIDPRFSDSAFGAEIAVQQILLALAAVAAFQPRRAVEVADGDIGGLMLATALGAFYLGLMTFIVKWYGDQPVDAAWYLARAHGALARLPRRRGPLRRGRADRRLRLGARARRAPRALRADRRFDARSASFLHDLWLAGPAAPALSRAGRAAGGRSPWPAISSDLRRATTPRRRRRIARARRAERPS